MNDKKDLEITLVASGLAHLLQLGNFSEEEIQKAQAMIRAATMTSFIKNPGADCSMGNMYKYAIKILEDFVANS